MSYALRNTLVLLTTLLLMAIGGWLYMMFYIDPQLVKLEAEIASKENDLSILSATAETYPLVRDQHAQIRFEYENQQKELFEDHNVASVFEFLRRVNSGSAYTQMNFAFQDSVANADHGIIKVQLVGEGSYESFFSFLTILEQSRPITKITNLRIAPVNELQKLGHIQFDMNVEFYYARGGTITDYTLLINRTMPANIYNPFYPLLHDVPPNFGDLPDVENMRIVGLTSRGVYIIDQNNEFKFLPVGSRVYLGRLVRVNLSRSTATFELNKGGIPDVVTLSISGRP